MDWTGITSTNKVWINRSFSNEVTVTTLVFQDSETAAMLVSRHGDEAVKNMSAGQVSENPKNVRSLTSDLTQ